MVQNESEKDADHNFSGQLLLAAGSLLLDFFPSVGANSGSSYRTVKAKGGQFWLSVSKGCAGSVPFWLFRIDSVN